MPGSAGNLVWKRSRCFTTGASFRICFSAKKVRKDSLDDILELEDKPVKKEVDLKAKREDKKVSPVIRSESRNFQEAEINKSNKKEDHDDDFDFLD